VDLAIPEKALISEYILNVKDFIDEIEKYLQKNIIK
jgi:hypothetical protein